MPHPLDVITYGEAMAMFVAAAPGPSRRQRSSRSALPGPI